MFEYNYLENLTLEQLNDLGADNWEITGILINATDNSYNIFAKKGFQEKTLITNETTGAKFWVDEIFSYSDSMIIIFLTIFIFCIIGKIIYNFFFRNA